VIKKIKISNFQSHKNTEINFSDRLNCVIGSTHVGKSALVRALRWVIYNDQFKDFITWGEDLCSVSVYFDSGSIVTREREKDTNRYILEKDGKREIFESFGLDIPPNIKKELNTAEILLSENLSFNLNVRSQHDPLFLLTDPGTTRAKALNSLIGVHIIDEALKDLAADGKREKILSTEIKERIVKLEEEIKSFGDLSFKENIAKKLQNLFLELKNKVEKFKSLKEFKENYFDFDVRVKGHESRKNSLKLYDYNKIVKLDKLYVTYKEMQEISNDIRYFSNKETDLIKRKEGIVKYDEKKIKSLESLHTKRDEILEFNEELVLFEEEYNNYANARKNVEKDLKCIKDDYTQVIRELKKCPVCFSNIDDVKIKEIVEHL
jgi:exonuclease SbcC